MYEISTYKRKVFFLFVLFFFSCTGVFGLDSLGSFPVTEVSDISGMSQVGDELWIVDATQDNIHRYNISTETFIGSFGLSGLHNHPLDIMVVGDEVWVSDSTTFGDTNARIYRYSTSTRNYLGRFSLSITLTPAGAMALVGDEYLLFRHRNNNPLYLERYDVDTRTQISRIEIQPSNWFALGATSVVDEVWYISHLFTANNDNYITRLNANTGSYIGNLTFDSSQDTISGIAHVREEIWVGQDQNNNEHVLRFRAPLNFNLVPSGTIGNFLLSPNRYLEFENPSLGQINLTLNNSITTVNRILDSSDLTGTTTRIDLFDYFGESSIDYDNDNTITVNGIHIFNFVPRSIVGDTLTVGWGFSDFQAVFIESDFAVEVDNPHNLRVSVLVNDVEVSSFSDSRNDSSFIQHLSYDTINTLKYKTIADEFERSFTPLVPVTFDPVIPTTFSSLSYDMNTVFSERDIPSGYSCFISVDPDGPLDRTLNTPCNTADQRENFRFGSGGRKNLTITLSRAGVPSIRRTQEILVNLPIQLQFWSGDTQLTDYTIDGETVSTVYSTTQNDLGFGSATLRFRKGSIDEDIVLDVTNTFHGPQAVSVGSPQTHFVTFNIHQSSGILIGVQPVSLVVDDSVVNVYTFNNYRYFLPNTYTDTTTLRVTVRTGGVEEQITKQVSPNQNTAVDVFLDSGDMTEIRRFEVVDNALNPIEDSEVTLHYLDDDGTFKVRNERDTDSGGLVFFEIIPESLIYNVCSFWEEEDSTACLNGLIFRSGDTSLRTIVHSIDSDIDLEPLIQDVPFTSSVTRLNDSSYTSVLFVNDSSGSVETFCTRIEDIPIYNNSPVSYVIQNVVRTEYTQCFSGSVGTITINLMLTNNASIKQHRFRVFNYYTLPNIEGEFPLDIDVVNEESEIRAFLLRPLIKLGIDVIILLLIFSGVGWFFSRVRDIDITMIALIGLITCIYFLQAYLFKNILLLNTIIIIGGYYVVYRYTKGES